MDFEFYRNFLIVAETGNITAAARKLALAQPALSAQIRTLERHYGIRLLETARGKRGVSLTPAGRDFLKVAQRLCEEEENLQLNMQSQSSKAAGLLRISVAPTQSGIFLQRYLVPFAAIHPGITFQVREEAIDQQLRHIASGSSDFAYANAPVAEAEELLLYGGQREYLYLVYEKENACGFRDGEELPLARLRGVPLCCNFSMYSLLQRACNSEGFNLDARFLASIGDTVLAFAKSRGLAAVVAAACEEELDDELGHSLLLGEGLSFSQTLFRLAGSRLSPAAKAFEEFFQKQGNI